ncbi:hypothetical protein R6Q57_019600 [Mikania cordata]
MEYTNQTDSILISLLRSAMDNAQNKIQSTTNQIECWIEASKFYELASIQIDAALKLVKELEDPVPKKMITDLIKLKHVLHGHMNNTTRLIMKKDKALMESLENETRLKSDQNVMIEQMKHDIDMFKEIFDLTIDQMDQTRHLDQQCEWLIEKETFLITIKAYIRDQSLEYSMKDAIIARLFEERQMSTLQTMTMEEHYIVLLHDSYKEFDIETKVREDVFVYVFFEVVNDIIIKFDFELQKIQNEIHVMLKLLLTNFQENVNEKLHMNILRLALSTRNEALVYKKAFTIRCENLLLAETEVDLLGDQVEELQNLLQKIYFILEQNSSDLSNNFQVMDALKMIKRV